MMRRSFLTMIASVLLPWKPAVASEVHRTAKYKAARMVRDLGYSAKSIQRAENHLIKMFVQLSKLRSSKERIHRKGIDVTDLVIKGFERDIVSWSQYLIEARVKARLPPESKLERFS